MIDNVISLSIHFVYDVILFLCMYICLQTTLGCHSLHLYRWNRLSGNVAVVSFKKTASDQVSTHRFVVRCVILPLQAHWRQHSSVIIHPPSLPPFLPSSFQPPLVFLPTHPLASGLAVRMWSLWCGNCDVARRHHLGGAEVRGLACDCIISYQWQKEWKRTCTHLYAQARTRTRTSHSSRSSV